MWISCPGRGAGGRSPKGQRWEKWEPWKLGWMMQEMWGWQSQMVLRMGGPPRSPMSGGSGPPSSGLTPGGLSYSLGIQWLPRIGWEDGTSWQASHSSCSLLLMLCKSCYPVGYLRNVLPPLIDFDIIYNFCIIHNLPPIRIWEDIAVLVNAIFKDRN